MICVRYTLSKAKNSYFTFLSNEGMTYLREYMKTRISDGDVLTLRLHHSSLILRGKDNSLFHKEAIISSRVLMNTLRLKGLVWNCSGLCGK